MADFSLPSLLAAMALSYGGAHPWGHISEASKMGVPGKVDYKRGVEMYDQNAWNKLSPEEQAKIHAAGFEGQQTLSNALTGSSMEDEMRLAQALYKLGYVAGIKPGGTQGDPGLIAETTGLSKGKVNTFLMTGALDDFDRALWHTGRKWSLQPEIVGDRGAAYGLKLTVPW